MIYGAADGETHSEKECSIRRQKAGGVQATDGELSSCLQAAGVVWRREVGQKQKLEVMGRDDIGRKSREGGKEQNGWKGQQWVVSGTDFRA